tara:strand:- start:1289 stop:1780 length:492 start_codon:yes stop_codon:yes gene_type:complete
MSKKYSKNPTTGIRELAGDVESLFSEDNFPDTDPGWLDAARHFYGQTLSVKNYGYPLSRAAGIYNEAEGFFRMGQTRRPVQDDFINNRAGRDFYYTNEAAPYIDIIEKGIVNPEGFEQAQKDSLINIVKEKGVWAHGMERVNDLSKSNRYSPKRIIEFIKDAY